MCVVTLIVPQLHLTEEEAADHMAKKIEQALQTGATQINDMFHMMRHA